MPLPFLTRFLVERSAVLADSAAPLAELFRDLTGGLVRRVPFPQLVGEGNDASSKKILRPIFQ